MNGNDYRLQHTAPTRGSDYYAPLDRLDAMVADIYERPDLYHGGDDAQTMRAVKSARGNPDQIVRVYRSVPKGVTVINPGDWVSLSEEYARQEGMHSTDESLDMPVIRMDVRAGDVWWDGNSLQEFGYSPADSTTPEEFR